MKRIFACVAMLAILVSLCVPAFAAEAEFTPSVSYKPAPEVVPSTDDAGNPVDGVIRDEDGNAVDYVETDHLIITAISEANTSEKIPADAKELLLEVNSKLNDGSMQIDYSKINKDLADKKMVIRDLFDASFVCQDCPPILAEEGNTLDVIFDLGVNNGVDIYAMVYVDGEWKSVVNTANNGDGTVTVTFDEICPVAFVMEDGSYEEPPKSGDVAIDMKWVIIGGVAVAAIVALVVVYVVDSKKRAAK